eukprot:TRINITY_DN19461_c0_g1_i1.p2 TRINITY_DN19461_c0_g1~~TRINITY_DN19461_c0_g1_i1.p2  ORF type:complete len:127 (+),score=20.45 TRINITY_DN19461_c0_g1_i1:400-780(+)
MGCAWLLGFVVLHVPLRHFAMHKATPQQITVFWVSMAIHSYALGHIADGNSIYTEFFRCHSLLGAIMRAVAAQQATPLADGSRGRGTRRSASLPCPILQSRGRGRGRLAAGPCGVGTRCVLAAAAV